MTQEEATQLGAFIRARREAAHLSLRALADKARLSAANLAKIEVGDVRQPSAEFLQRIARHLGCDYEDLAALAGYSLPEGLPNLPVYLRTKYGELSPSEIAQVDGYVRYLRDRHPQDQEEEAGDQPSR